MRKLTKEFCNQKLNVSKATKLYEEIEKATRYSALPNAGMLVDPSFCVAFYAYLLSKVAEHENPSEITYDQLITFTNDFDTEIIDTIKTMLTSEIWNKLLPLTETTEAELFALAALIQIESNASYHDFTTPKSLIDLSKKILDIQSTDEVADICCGAGNFIVSSSLDKPAKYTGYEINFNNTILTKIRAELIEANVELKLGNIFSDEETTNSSVFDKVFSNYPFKLNLRTSFGNADYVNKVFKRIPTISKTTSSDWYFNLLICDHLKDTGKGIGIMPIGCSWNTTDLEMRKYFVENNLIEAVISLPPRMFNVTGIQTSLVIFSKTPKDYIRMIDASNICLKGRRTNSFDEDNIETIIEALNKDSSYSKKISKTELEENEYSLYLPRYYQEECSFENAVEFGSIIKSILRGAPCKASELDAILSAEETNMQYLMLSNIKNGIIEENLPYLTKIDPKYEKYCLKNNTLILSKNGYPYKIAVAEIKDNQKILANGNLYMIEVDEEKANPLFIKAFLESEAGVSTLKSITVGSAIPNIGVENLKKIKVPLPSLEEQQKIVDKYNAKLDEIAILKTRLATAQDELKHIIEG